MQAPLVAALPHSPTHRVQHGIAALSVTVLLLFAMLLVVAVTNRNVVVEMRASASQYRSTQAFEAAEAGLEWALAKLNDDATLGDDCLPSTAAGARSFRDRVLVDDDALPGFRPATWDDAGTARVQQVACLRAESGWSCSCPSGGAPTLPATATMTVAPAFVVAFAPGAKPGIVVASAVGCTQAGASCLDSASSGHDATARLEVAFGLVPGLRSAPAAALTVRGNLDAGTAALGLQNRDARSGGMAVHAGGRIAGSALRLAAPPGSPLDGSLVSGDTQLAGLAVDRLFARWFAMDKAAWSAQPAVRHLTCLGDCTADLLSAIAAGHRLIAVAGDLGVHGPVVLGSAQRPVVLVVDGAARLTGNVSLNGLVYAGAIEWQDASAGAAIDGAAISEHDYIGNADADIVRDPIVLERLRSGTGTFARVSGSWKDF